MPGQPAVLVECISAFLRLITLPQPYFRGPVPMLQFALATRHLRHSRRRQHTGTRAVQGSLGGRLGPWVGPAAARAGNARSQLKRDGRRLLNCVLA